jgi:hypothetical protein
MSSFYSPSFPANTQDVCLVPVGSIVVKDGFNHRVWFDDDDQAELEAQIAASKEVEPLTVRRIVSVTDDETGEPELQLVKGERRLRAMIALAKEGLLLYPGPKGAYVPVKVIETDSNFEAVRSSFLENFGRKDVTWIERVYGLNEAAKAYRSEHKEATNPEIAKALGLTPTGGPVLLSYAESIAACAWFAPALAKYRDEGVLYLSEETARRMATKKHREAGERVMAEAIEKSEPLTDEAFEGMRARGAFGGPDGDKPEGAKAGKKGKKGGGGAGFKWAQDYPTVYTAAKKLRERAAKPDADATFARDALTVAEALEWVIKGKKIPAAIKHFGVLDDK